MILTYNETLDKQFRSWIASCYDKASESPDTSTQIGAMLIDGGPVWPTLQCNTFTNGWEPGPYDLERPLKYQLVEHAERNCLYRAASYGQRLRGTTMVATWAACAECARAIVQVGIVRLIRHYPPIDEATERWLESISIGDRILKAGGVDIIDIIGRIPGATPVLRGGVLYDPSL